jgi:hypothetical protein
MGASWSMTNPAAMPRISKSRLADLNLSYQDMRNQPGLLFQLIFIQVEIFFEIKAAAISSHTCCDETDLFFNYLRVRNGCCRAN